MKLIDRDAVAAEIERRINNIILTPEEEAELKQNSPDQYGVILGYRAALSILDDVEASKVSSKVSEDLEEASKNYALNNTPWDDCKDEIQESFKAGAEWQKQQMMKNAVEGVVTDERSYNSYEVDEIDITVDYDINTTPFVTGDKVKLIIIEEVTE